MTKRFADVDMNEILLSKYAKSTMKTNSYVENLLKNFCDIKEFNYENELSLSVWNDVLSHFYASVRKEDGESFNTASLKSIRYSVARVLKDKLSTDIITDVAFTKSNEIFTALLKKMKNDGKGSTHHHDVIEEEDLKKLKEMPTNTPTLLQWKTWTTIMLHFLNRGNENIKDMKKSDLHIEIEGDKKVIRLRDFKTKNHQGMSSQASTEAVIYSNGTDNCPVSLIEMYLSKLNPINENLWQKPKQRFSKSEWYCNQSVGINKMSTFMKEIAKYLGMSKVYTNHCLRATGITSLARGFQDTDIASFSGHKSLNALAIYKRTPNKTKEFMSQNLHQCIYGENVAIGTNLPFPQPVDNTHNSTFCTSLPNLELPSNDSHRNCCISIGATNSHTDCNFEEPFDLSSFDLMESNYNAEKTDNPVGNVSLTLPQNKSNVEKKMKLINTMFANNHINSVVINFNNA